MPNPRSVHFPSSPARQARAELPDPPPEAAPPPLLSAPQICMLGSLQRDNKTVEDLLKHLPESEAGYHGSLHAALTTLDRMRSNIHALLKAYMEDL